MKIYLVYLILFTPLWSNLVNIGPILSTSTLFSLFCPLWFYSVHFVYSGSIRSILSTSVLFGPICSLRFYSVHLVHFVPFGPIQFIWIILFHFDLFLYTYIMGKDMFRSKEHNLNPNLLKNI